MIGVFRQWQVEPASGRHRRDAPALACSAGLHAAVIATALLVVSHSTGPLSDGSRGRLLPQALVWLNQPGPAGGGGGGGNRRAEPPARLTVAGSDRVSMPAASRPPLEAPAAVPDDAPQLTQAFVVPAVFSGASLDTRPGMPGGALDAGSRGPGDGPGAGSGRGSGAGPGDGPGLGNGTDGGSGGDFFLPGGGVETPVPIRKVKPIYTPEAMAARIQGSAWVECIVLADGTVGRLRLVRSVDSVHGLDQEAIKAARQWRFRPGRRGGQPVPVLVTIAIDFNLF